MENAYKVLDIIKELKSNHIGCYSKVSILIPNHFGKHVKRTSKIKIAIYKKT